MSAIAPTGMTAAVAAPRRRETAAARGGLLTALADLRLTVVLFALLIFLVFAGTLAQVDHDVWYVVNEGYFRVWFAWVELQGFVRLVELFTKGEAQPIAGGFWFPGGKLIGAAMFANLLAAHAVRFRVAARGARLAAGLAVLAAGVAATCWVLAAGMDQALKGQISPAMGDSLWQAWRATTVCFAGLAVWWCVQNRGRVRGAEWWLAAAAAAALAGVAAYVMVDPSARPDDAGMRIVWELTKCGGAAVLTFLGCWVVFRQRAGIVLLHAGIGLLMVGELVTDLTAEEGRMSIAEGATVNYAEDIRAAELAITTPDGDADRVVVVPARMLAAAARSGEPIREGGLPFDLRVVRFDPNAALAPPVPGAENPATAGAGLARVAVPQRGATGVDADATVDLPAAYVEPLDRATGKSLGVWLTAIGLTPQPVADAAHSAERATHSVELRFKRTYKPYSVTLTDFEFRRYAGTEVAKDFSSHVILSDPDRGVELPLRVWMNNPVRYAGDTLYQSGYDPRTEASTILQVVTNSGWMIPYVSCAYVALGMLSHFAITLLRFMRRRVEESQRAAVAADTLPMESLAKAGPRWSLGSLRHATVWAPALAAVVAAAYFAGKARPASDDGLVERMAALPVAEGGRVKPLDTLARTTLQAISSRQEVLRKGADGKRLPPVSAAAWLLDTVSQRDGWRDHRVFRVENLETIEAFGMEPRPGSYRYSYAEVMADPEAADWRFRGAFESNDRYERAKESGANAEPPTLVEQQVLRLAAKVRQVEQLAVAFQEPPIGGEGADVRQQLARAQGIAETLRGGRAPRAVPPNSSDGLWSTLFEENLANLVRLVTKQAPNEAALAWSDALDAYGRGDRAALVKSVTAIEGEIAERERAQDAAPDSAAKLAASERLSAAKVRFEHSFNAFSPVYHCAAMYLVAFVLTAAGWLGQGGGRWSRALGRAAVAVLLVTLAVHTFALVGRVYISGRPPVTNLYSSAVFIGWGAALFALAFEAIYRLSIGAAVASAIGFATLVVAHNLSLEGDTFTVLQAVLDTQFWLATHVVCITLGYSTTYLAGFLGAAYLIALAAPALVGWESRLDKRAADHVVRMVYGTLCFALLFSFVGTVLGGLWADDSWGRFWGWDPKENGALIIVLWNALVLHARWGKMIGPAGLATLAVGGNVVTTWSWFGVNELGVGLHAYGASESSTATWLLGFVLSQLAVVALGVLLPRTRAAS